MDINPATRGHALVVPRAHADGPARRSAPRTSRRAPPPPSASRARAQDALGADGVNLLNSCGAAAWQTVFHFHLHVIPRYADDPLRLPWIPAPGDTGRDRRGRRGAARVSAACRSASSSEGPLAVLTFDAPPLNLFDAAMIDGPAGGRRRRRGRPAARPARPGRGAGRQRRGRRAPLRRPLAARTAGELWTDLLRDDPHRRGAALPDRVRRARALPDGRVRALAGLRPAAGRRVGAASASWRPSSG